MGILLRKKLLHTIQSTFRQFIALVVVIVIGVALFVGLKTAYNNIRLSIDHFYAAQGFADYTFQLVKAPESILKEISDIPGVIQVNGRIQKDVQVVKSDNNRITGRLTSYVLPMDHNINKLYPLEGRLFTREQYSSQMKAAINQAFADANHYVPGDQIKIIASGTVTSLYLTGTAISPEFQAICRDAASWFEGDSFGIIMLSQEDAQEILKMNDQINQVLIDLSPGADEKLIKVAAEKILEPYGVLNSYPRKDHLSERSVQGNLDALGTASQLMPYLFFSIVVLFLFILLKQIIASQRPQIGVMKAIGYDNTAIMIFYTVYSLIITLSGAVLGILAGYYLSEIVTGIFAGVFSLPYTVGGIDYLIIAEAVLICVLTGTIAALLSSRQITSINPAEVMKQAEPLSADSTFLEDFSGLWSKFSGSWKMTFRSIARNKTRFTITALGITSSIVLLMAGLCYNDSKNYLMEHHFEYANAYDYKVHFANFPNQTELSYWLKWDEIQRLETIAEIPVTFSAANGGKIHEKSENGLLTGINPQVQLKKVFNTSMDQIEIPQNGILLSQQTAAKLNLRTGDMVEVETKLGSGKEQKALLKICGITKQYVEAASIVSIEQINQLLHEENTINTALIQMDNKGEAKLLQHLKDIPKIDYILTTQKQRAEAEKTMASLFFFTVVVIVCAVLLGFAIVYNTSVMMFSDRQRELAALRVIGFSNGSISMLLFNELLLDLLFGIALGLPSGRLIGGYYIQSIGTDYTSYPFAMNISTYLTAVGLTAGFVVIGHLLAMLRLKDLDLIEVLKNRE